MNQLLRLSVLPIVSFALLAGCDPETTLTERPDAPALYTEVDLPDDELAMQALAILGSSAAGSSGSCSTCHGITRRSMTRWAEQAQVIMDTCLTDLEVSTDANAASMVACLHGPTTDGMNGMYAASSASIFSAAADGAWFRFVFEHGAGESWQSEYDDFVRYAGMPNEDMPALTQAEFDIVATWFLRGAPEADSVLPVDPAPAACEPFISPEVAAHVTRMSTEGWAARNLADGILMHGCAGASRPEDCLAGEPAARDQSYGEGWDTITGSTIRELFTTDYASAFWTRSSADGRFVAHGPGDVIDLQRDVVIPIDSPYDPGFFPDNRAFVWPGVVCEQSLLTSNPTMITLNEPECDRAAIGLYEHVGVALSGSDYWVITGEFSSDNGGHGTTRRDTPAGFSRDSAQTFTRMTNTGSGFAAGAVGSYGTPFEGDAVISPSSTVVLGRIAGPGDAPIGYTLYSIETGGAMGGDVGSCSGTPAACAGRSNTECRDGCTLGACSGTAASCDTFTTGPDCGSQSGCAWSGVSCSGTARACEALMSAFCENQSGCALDAAAACMGTPNACSGSSTESTCGAVAGCSWSTMPGPTTGGPVRLRELARYCEPGNKVAFSYDERYFITQHYNDDDDAVELGFTGPTDPAFAAYRTEGSADLILIDLATGTRTRLTHMGPGQYALFPHFRSDGWIYFLVRGDTGIGGAGERVMATDAIFHLGN